MVYFGPQTAKNRTGVLTDPSAMVQKTGVNKSAAFARGQHAYQRAAITLGIGTHLVFLSSAAADTYQAINTLAPGKVARIKPSKEMQAYSGQRPKAFGKGNIIHLYLSSTFCPTEKERD